MEKTTLEEILDIVATADEETLQFIEAFIERERDPKAHKGVA